MGARGRSRERGRIGLALGSGGARGLFHIQVLETLDRFGFRPSRIAGSSIGAVMGALYASGLAAADLRKALESITRAHEESWFEASWLRDWTSWLRFIDPGSTRGGLARSNSLIDFLRETAGGVSRFEDLEIPLRVVATDLWSREIVVFEQGDLWTAVQASMAVPGLLEPVDRDGRVLVDGGLTSPVPFDLLEDCDPIIAVDVLGMRNPDGHGGHPSPLDSIFNAFQIMQSSILKEKLKRLEPSLLLQPDIRGVRVLDFHRYEEIFAQGEPARDVLESRLRAWSGS